MVIRDFNKGTTGFVKFDKTPGAAPRGTPETLDQANSKDGGHTLVFIFPSLVA